MPWMNGWSEWKEGANGLVCKMRDEPFYRKYRIVSYRILL